MRKLEKPTRTYWRDSAMAGAIAGAVMLLYTGLSTGVFGAGVWFPFAVLEQGALPGTPVAMPGFDAFTTPVSMALHLLAASAWGLAYGAFLSLLSTYGPPAMARSWAVAVLMGLAWGAAVYAIMGLWIAPAFNPQVFWLNPMTHFVSHLIFGLVTALALTSLTRRKRVRVTFAPEEAPVRTMSRR